MNNLLTLKQIAAELNLPPSTVKYYRDMFPEYMPGVKGGRYVKYEPPALEIIDTISKGFKNNLEQQQIRELLNSKFALNIEPAENEPTTTTVATTEQQQLMVLSQAKDEINFLRELVNKQAALIEELSKPWYIKMFTRQKGDDDS